MAVKIIFIFLATLKYVEYCLKKTMVSHEYKVNFKITQAFTIHIAFLFYHIFNNFFLGAMYCNSLFHHFSVYVHSGFFVFCFVSNNKAVIIIINVLVHGLMCPLEADSPLQWVSRSLELHYLRSSPSDLTV